MNKLSVLFLLVLFLGFTTNAEAYANKVVKANNTHENKNQAQKSDTEDNADGNESDARADEDVLIDLFSFTYPQVTVALTENVCELTAVYHFSVAHPLLEIISPPPEV